MLITLSVAGARNPLNYKTRNLQSQIKKFVWQIVMKRKKNVTGKILVANADVHFGCIGPYQGSVTGKGISEMLKK